MCQFLLVACKQYVVDILYIEQIAFVKNIDS